MIAKIVEAVRRILFVPPPYPVQVQLEVTNRCNLNCPMCPREKLGVIEEDMPFELFQQIIEKIKGVKLVTLTGWGEPFLHPELFSMIVYCKRKGMKVKLTTNGVLIDSTVQKKIIDTGLDSITFSLETIGGEEHLGHPEMGTIENLVGLLKMRKDRIPEVVVQITLHQKKEKELLEVIKYSAEIGVDRINLARLDMRFNQHLKRPTPAEERKIFGAADRLGREKGIQIDFIPYEVSQGLERFGYRVFRKSLHVFGRYCLRLYDYLYINLKGEVTPCCSLPLYSVGNILKEDLKDIWNGERLKKFRRRQREICGSCDQFQIRYNNPK